MEKSIEDTMNGDMHSRVDNNINVSNPLVASVEEVGINDTDRIESNENKIDSDAFVGIKSVEEKEAELTSNTTNQIPDNEVIESLEYTNKEFGLIQFIKDEMKLTSHDVRSYSPLTLAFIGDVVYDLVIRTMVVEQGNAPVNKLHKKVSNLVKAPAQMELFHKIESVLTEEEMGIYKRGRNAKSFTSAKNASITEYRIATGFEALLGHLYLDNKFPRILQLIKYGLDK